MSEERFVKTEADATTLLIIERLAERKRKLNRITELEHNYRGEKRHIVGNKYGLYVHFLLVACLLAALFIWPLCRTQKSPLDHIGIATPTLSEYRAANDYMDDIELLLSKKCYKEALPKTKQALEKSNMTILELRKKPVVGNDEELMYEIELECQVNSELRWAYIYLLVRLDRNKEAKAQLKLYLKNRIYCEHVKEAEALLDMIDRKTI